ncbi:hypothetical protein E4O86_14190 [Rhizobiales bacterium L72]|uniref:Uncharacterized protein n=1 Tax=Propylenella binzhouense TaxID=2555902 RepID=A0A964WUA8_9HYPH|nr:hypothetical protein [Propylenella binzhouense]
MRSPPPCRTHSTGASSNGGWRAPRIPACRRRRSRRSSPRTRAGRIPSAWRSAPRRRSSAPIRRAPGSSPSTRPSRR